MSIQLIDHNSDLARLKNEGYTMDIINDHLVVRGIPYITENKKIDFGILYCELQRSGDEVYPPRDHTARFVGSHPCNQFGVPDKSYVHSNQRHNLSDSIAGEYYFSSKPASGNYPDYYSKVSRYTDLLSNPAKSLDSSVTHCNFDYKAYQEDSVFEFSDSYSARAGIYEVNSKLKEQNVAIIGLGGTGSHLLDHLCKTYVNQISLFDGDVIQNHNLFRMPGAIIPSDLSKGMSKVEFFKQRYSRFRKNIIAHDVYLDAGNLDLLNDHDFVFLSIDNTAAKKVITDDLLEKNIPFVDLGMGLSKVNESIRGQVRNTLITPDHKLHIDKINMQPTSDEDIYNENIQISELNALNAILGIITWKKLCGVYLSDISEMEHNSVYIIDAGDLVNEA